MKELSIIIEAHGAVLCTIVLIYLLKAHVLEEDLTREFAKVLEGGVIILVSDIIVTMYDGKPGQTARILGIISCFVMYCAQYRVIMLLGKYIYLTLKKKKEELTKWWCWMIEILCTFVHILVFITLWTGFVYYFDEQNLYHRGTGFIFTMTATMISILLCMYAVIRYRKLLDSLERFTLSSIFMAPLLGVILQVFTPGISLSNIGIAFSILLIALASLYNTQREMNRRRYLLLQNRAYLINSQMQPEFTFQSLETIQKLIDEDANLAQEAVGQFSKFLRQSMKFENVNGLTSIQNEVEYLKKYLYMERLRYKDKFEVMYDIDDNLDFLIPFLTIQPIVENAIIHGILPKKDPCILGIMICEEEDEYIIEITDDGIGFDVDAWKMIEPKISTRKVDIRNVEERLKLQCNGKLEISSTADIGTTVTIMIPKQEERR